METVIFHIDVNSAFLSWEAKHLSDEYNKRIENGEDAAPFVDIRDIPSIIGGSEEMRHGIVLAKSTPAKRYGIITGEPIASARKKCPGIVILPPNHDRYAEYSAMFIALLKRYAPEVEQYSIDEAFCDMTGTGKLYGDPVEFAHKLKDIIKSELGFTVNIGISSNRILAKMASDFQKPDRVHTLWPDEIRSKLWPLPVNDLFFVGHSTSKKLKDLGISTIGELAKMDLRVLTYHFKKHGETIWNYANGIDNNSLRVKGGDAKSYSNEQTISFDVTERDTAKEFILALCESVAARIRADNTYISVVSIHLTDNEFNNHSRQMSLPSPTNVTEQIYDCALSLFDKCWNKKPIRLIGVYTGKATSTVFTQYDMFDTEKYEKLSRLNSAMDSIRNKYGNAAITRAAFLKRKDDT